MPTVFTKQAAVIQPPSNDPADVTSGCQPAANSGILGNTTSADGALVAGQDIGAAAVAGYFEVTVT